jgi:hypothetical protein
MKKHTTKYLKENLLLKTKCSFYIQMFLNIYYFYVDIFLKNLYTFQDINIIIIRLYLINVNKYMVKIQFDPHKISNITI